MYLIFDTETEGLDKEKDKFYQLSYIVLNDNYGFVKARNYMFTPINELNPGAQQACGRNKEFIRALVDNKQFEDVDFSEFKQDYENSVVIGYNTEYDKAMVRNTLEDIKEPIKTIDVMQDVTPIFKLPRKEGGFRFPKLSLVESRLKRFININEAVELCYGNPNIPSHDSRKDVVVTMLAFRAIRQKPEFLYK